MRTREKRKEGGRGVETSFLEKKPGLSGDATTRSRTRALPKNEKSKESKEGQKKSLREDT